MESGDARRHCFVARAKFVVTLVGHAVWNRLDFFDLLLFRSFIYTYEPSNIRGKFFRIHRSFTIPLSGEDILRFSEVLPRCVEAKTQPAREFLLGASAFIAKSSSIAPDCANDSSSVLFCLGILNHPGWKPQTLSHEPPDPKILKYSAANSDLRL